MLTDAKLSNMKLFLLTINDKTLRRSLIFLEIFVQLLTKEGGIMLGNLYRTGLYGNAENQSN